MLGDQRALIFWHDLGGHRDHGLDVHLLEIVEAFGGL